MHLYSTRWTVLFVINEFIILKLFYMLHISYVLLIVFKFFMCSLNLSTTNTEIIFTVY